MTTPDLPPLPAPAQEAQPPAYMPGCPIEIPGTPDYFDADQMRAYAAAAVLAEREKSEAMRAAVLGACGALHGDGVNDQGEAWDKALRILDAARAAIRAEPKKEQQP